MPPSVNTYAIDFETTYTKDRDIKTLGVVPYLEHPDTDIYLVSIRGPGVDFCGAPGDAPWAAINGHHWVSHNAGFDAAAFMELRRVADGALDDIAPCEWDCTANLAAFLGCPRSLAGAVEQLYGVILDKSTRDRMKGKTWESMTPEFRAESITYARADSEWCLRIWEDYAGRWPEQERAISRHTMAMCLNGIGIDLPRVNEYIERLTATLWAVEQDIPWLGELDAKGKPLTINSRKAFFEACLKAGIPPPKSTADKDPRYEAWLDSYGESAPFVHALKDHRRINRVLEILKKLRDQTRADGRLRYSLLYFGAHTGRWAGSGGINFQNLSRHPLCFDADGKLMPKDTEAKDAATAIDLRSCLIPAPGKKFIVADLAQIEARVTLWYAGDFEQLALLKTMDVYEAHARRTMGYTDPRKLSVYVKDPDCPESKRTLRQIAKARVLGLGFGMGFKKLREYAKAQIGLDLPEEQARRIVTEFRAANPGITALWRRFDTMLRQHVAKKDRALFQVELPSWRTLEYFDFNEASGGITARDERGGVMKHWHGGILTENMVQATARDVLVENILRIEAAGYSVVLHVHDEVIVEVDADVPEDAIYQCMAVTPTWAEGLPVDSSVDSAERYFKD